MLQKRAIRAISSAGYNAGHTEPLFKFYNVLKVEDIYNYRLLVLYYNLKHKNVPFHIASFMPKTSKGVFKGGGGSGGSNPPPKISDFFEK